MFARDKIHYEAIPLPDRVAAKDDAMLKQAKDFLATMKKRHTVRDFSERSVDQSLIETCIAAAGTAPSGANHQPWHFCAISAHSVKHQIRKAAEKEEEAFYAGGASDEWIKALEPLGTDANKSHLEQAPWLIVVFAQRWGQFEDGQRFKNYYVPESVGIATGMLLTALHMSGLVSLTHTPNPMGFLNGLLGRPDSEKPTMIIATGHPSDQATIPAVAKLKKPLSDIMTVFG